MITQMRYKKEMSMKFYVFIFSFVLIHASIFGDSHKNVFFKEPKDGATVNTKFKVVFGISKNKMKEGWKVVPSGPLQEKTGHHHLLIDQGPLAKGTIVPVGPKTIHYGKGQTETQLNLEPGTHKLTAQFADGNHSSYGPEWSDSITVTVK